MEKPFELTCEYEINPLGVDATQPRLSWLLTSNERGQMQSAYQVLVSNSKEEIDSDFLNRFLRFPGNAVFRLFVSWRGFIIRFRNIKEEPII